MSNVNMSLDDTLEIDYKIINKKADNEADFNSDEFEVSEIQTNTLVFNPQKSGTHNIKLNGQSISVKVTDPTNIPDNVVINGELKSFYDLNTKSPGSYTVNEKSIELKGKDTGSGTDGNFAEILTSKDYDKGSLDSVDIEFSLTQFGDNNANTGDFEFRVYEDDFQNPLAKFANNSVGSNISKGVRTVDLSEATGTGPIRFRADRSGSGPVENFGGTVTIYNLTFN